MKRVLVTGATGFVGAHLVEELSKKDVEIYALCRPDSKSLYRINQFKNVHIIWGALECFDKILESLKGREFDVLYHLAWEGASGEFRQNYEVQISNINWTVKVAEIAVRLNCKKIVITGTVCENQCNALLRQKEFVKSSYYLYAKKCAYEMVTAYSKLHNIQLVWCTFYHPLGIYNKREQLLINTIDKLRKKEPLLFSSATQLFDVIAVEDLSHALYLAGEKNLKYNRYFIGSGTPKPLYEYLEIAKEMIDKNAQMQYGAYMDDGLPMEKNWLDVKPFQEETGFKVKYTFEDCVEKTLNWLEAMNYDNKK